MTTPHVSIIIVDDNKIFLDSVEFFLNKSSNYSIIEKAYDGEQILKIDNVHMADVLLMDIEMPNLDGIQATKKLLRDNNELRVIALTNYEERAYLYELIAAGFKGCVLKKNTFDHIDNAIQTVLNGQLFFPDSIKI